MNKFRYPSLNGLRALSIIMVIFCHLSLKYNIFDSLNKVTWLQPITSLISDGYIGVNTFFIVSGFLITSLLLKEEKEKKSISFRKFYFRRILRIFPAYYFLLLIYFVLQKSGHLEISNESWLTSLTYTKYFNWQLDWPTSHFWSLSIEEQFYLFWPLVFILGKRPRIIFACLLLVIVPVSKLLGSFYFIGWINDLNILRRIDAIALGCIFAIYQDVIITKLRKHWSMYFNFSLIILLLSNFNLQESLKLFFGRYFYIANSMYSSIVNLMIAIIMMYSVFGPQKRWFKMLNTGALNFIGILSYSLYLWQQFFIWDTHYYLNVFPLNILCLFIAATSSYYLIEKPFLRFKTRFEVD